MNNKEISSKLTDMDFDLIFSESLDILIFIDFCNIKKSFIKLSKLAKNAFFDIS